MKFKFDTTDNYCIIAPDYPNLNENLADNLLEEIQKRLNNEESNFIICLDNTEDSDTEGRNKLLQLHELVYKHSGSLVFTGLNDLILKTIKKEQLHIHLNITPTLIEAKDIINMEILERELFNEH